MADNFVIRWNIDNFHVNGKRESEVWNEGGFLWNAVAEKGSNWLIDTISLSIFCRAHHNGPWHCKAYVSILMLRVDGTSRMITAYNNSEITIEFRINIVSSSGGNNCIAPNLDAVDLSIFSSPNEASNVTLLMGEKKVVASRDFLAIHSPVLSKMFYGDFKEKGKDEVAIEEVEYEEFITLLLVIFPGGIDISDATVRQIAKLADRFLMKSVLTSVEKHLLTSNRFSTEEKMQMADEYRFVKLRDQCLQCYKTLNDLKVFKGKHMFEHFSDKTKIAICERMFQLL